MADITPGGLFPELEILVRALGTAFPQADPREVRRVAVEYAERAGLTRLDEDLPPLSARQRARLALFLWNRLGEGTPLGLSADRPLLSPGGGQVVQAPAQPAYVF